MYENRSGDGNFIMAREATHNLNGCGRYRRKLFTKLLQRNYSRREGWSRAGCLGRG